MSISGRCNLRVKLLYSRIMDSNFKSLPEDLSGVHIHFVGIKGTGMAALVEILFERGAIITGSDVEERFYTDAILEKRGLKALPFSEKNITEQIQYVIYSSAYSCEKNPDLQEARRRGLPLLLYSEALGAISAQSYSCGVCGVHGKTTTTGLVGTILKELDLPSQVLAGSIISSFDQLSDAGSCTMTSKTYRQGGKNIFVAETCEYQRHFMAFHPKKIILTAVESDHQDYYPTYTDIQNAFIDYICLLPAGGQLIYCADDAGACETAKMARQKRPDIVMLPYGTNAAGAYKLTFGKVKNGRQYFSIGELGECSLCIPGTHNARNAAAAVALCTELLKDSNKASGDNFELIKAALLNFRGGRRRSELVGKSKTPGGQEVLFIDDYGHHPTAVTTTLAGYREFFKGHKIIVDFMSHTYTRTAALLNEFAKAFGSADTVIINKIYGSAREDASAANVTGEILAQRASRYHENVHFCKEFDQAAEFALTELSKPSGAAYPDGYLFVTMGAGDNWKVGTLLMEKLSRGTI